MRLGDFILRHMEPILQRWEEFAATIVPPALTMNSKALRNHSRRMLEEIALDLRSSQTEFEQLEKSQARGPRISDETAAETHASARLVSGYSIEQLFSEYRALRASVLYLWSTHADGALATDPADVMRFNEAIDQSIAESVSRYAETVSNSQNLFLAILGHDLRNPLSSIIMAAGVLIRAPDLDPKHAATAKRILSSGHRMNKLVNDLIDYTRTHLGSDLPLTLRAADIEKICRDTVAEHQLAHPGRVIEVDASGRFDGMWDDSRIAQVFSNLIGNAIQHGDTQAPIRITLRSGADSVVADIANRGNLIPAERIGALFEPLVRFADLGKSIEQNDNSLGIGLYIAREIIHSHEGTISVSSTEAGGTIFSVTLPRLPGRK